MQLGCVEHRGFDKLPIVLGIGDCLVIGKRALDQASLRRFALKIHFGYLTSEKAWKMFRSECEGRPTVAHRRLLATMTNLTPGDFAAVKRRLDILGQKSDPEALLRGLEEESRIKEEAPATAIGFLH
ncbi:MAG: hypothetical protein R8K46_08480 [Mariprofundaceae bacterium]